MSEQHKHNKRSGLLRAIGEADRTPEYKQARDEFVDTVNDFLATMSEVQSRGGTVEIQDGYHIPISDKPRLTRTLLADSGWKRTYAEQAEPGVSLTGDGVYETRSLQAVTSDGTIIAIEGTNPLLPKDENGDYTRRSRGDGDFAKITINRTITELDAVKDITEEYYVLGDGSTSEKTLDSGEIGPNLPRDQQSPASMETGIHVIEVLSESWGVEPGSPAT